MVQVLLMLPRVSQSRDMGELLASRGAELLNCVILVPTPRAAVALWPETRLNQEFCVSPSHLLTCPRVFPAVSTAEPM